VRTRAFGKTARSLVLAGAGCVSACTAHRAYRDLAKWEEDLQLSIAPTSFQAGQTTRLALRLDHHGDRAIDACLGYTLHFGIFPPGTGHGRTEAHKGCHRPFRLDPGGSFEWSEEVDVPAKAVPGAAKVLVVVDLVHPRSCDRKYGCYSRSILALGDVTVR
jgi:hypothetical protein